MLTELGINFGRRVLKVVGVDMGFALQPVVSKQPVSATLILNALARTLYTWILWIALWIVIGAGFVIATALLHEASSKEHRVVVYYLLIPMAFVTTGFVVSILRFGIVAPMAQRASARLKLQGTTIEPAETHNLSPLLRFVIFPGDYDFVFAVIVAVAVALLTRPLLD